MANVYMLSVPSDSEGSFVLPIACFSSAKRAAEWAMDWAFDDDSNVSARQDAIGASEDLDDDAIADFTLFSESGESMDVAKIKAYFRGKPDSTLILRDNTEAVTFALTYKQTL